MSSWEFLPPSWRSSRSPSRSSRPSAGPDSVAGADEDDHSTAKPSTGGRGSSGPLYAKPRHALDFDDADPPSSQIESDASVARADVGSSSQAAAAARSGGDAAKSVASLEHELKEKRWAVARAVELSETLAETQQALHIAQEQLATQTSKLQSSEERVAELVRRLEEAQHVQRTLLSRSGCLNCVLHREDEMRKDLIADQQAARYVIEIEWASYAATWQFAERQCAETEVELMWLEDQRAHAAAMRGFQLEINRVDELKATIRALKKECDSTKTKYRDLKEKGRAHIEELKAAHEENMRRARATYLRCNPNQAVLIWSFSKVRQSIKAAFDSGAQLGHARKELWVLREQLAALKVSVRQNLAAMSADVQGALRICLPVMWTPSVAVDARSTSPAPVPKSVRPDVAFGKGGAVAARLPSPTTYHQQLASKPRGRSPPIRPMAAKPAIHKDAVVPFHE